MFVRIKTLVRASALLLLVGPAFADAIDGSWCHTDGRRFSIRGPEIVTPAGKRLEGDYSRHAFSYTVLAPEPGAGQTIFMLLLNEDTVQLRHGEATASAPQEIWIRCGPSVSALEVWPRS